MDVQSQLIVQWSYIIYFHIRGVFLTTFGTSVCKRVHNSREIVNLQGFVCFDRWLRRYQNIYPPTKYYYIIERVCFIHCLLMLFISTISFLQFLYSASWEYKRDYLHASIDILF